jgi:tRNA nucleotidyltransferase (CCA-adding enzyme)
MTIDEVIATHSNTDFDAFAAMVAAHKLYPEAQMCLSGSVNRNVREFRTLFGDEFHTVETGAVDIEKVRRLILVETWHPNRLGELGVLCGRAGVEVVVFDHHRPDGELPEFVAAENFISSDDGSLITLMLHILAERGIPVTATEATLFALGIHEDTGSLTFPTTTVRDAEALSFCLRRGANQRLVERFLHNPLTTAQRDLLVNVLERARPVTAGGLDVLVATTRGAEYVEGVSLVVHKAMDLTNCDAFVLLVEMEDRVFVTARSRAAALNVSQVLKVVGGGGHAAAASAVVKKTTLAATRRRLVASLRRGVRAAPTAATLMSHPVHWVTSETTVDEALVLCERHGLGGLSVAEDDELVGSVARRDLDRALRHGLGHAPVKAVMTGAATVVAPDTPIDELTRVLADDPLGRVPVARTTTAPVPVDHVVGVVTRSDLLQALHVVAHPQSATTGLDVSDRLAGLGLDRLLQQVQAAAAAFRGVYLVGGAVRDLLLEERLVDIDIAVEGEGIEFARELARRLKGRVRVHEKFQTAVIIAPDEGGRAPLRVDVASTRTEFYDYPAALPKVEHATIRGDLARRDFSINAMAVSLNPRDFGALLDYFGGYDDLREGRIAVLHNLSFIEDPTRIFRAVRYENRYGFEMDEHTFGLARSCSEMDLIGDLSSARLRDELVLLFDEEKVSHTLRRLEQLGLQVAVHPRIDLGATGEDLVTKGDALRSRLGVEDEVPRWRLRLALLLRDLEPEEIERWTRRMRFRRADGDVLVRAFLLGSRLERRLRRPMKEVELYETVHDEPLEALLVAAVLSAGGAAEKRLAHYLTHTRHVRLEIGGRDLLERGFEESAALGDVLHDLLRMKIEGLISGRQQELEAAERLR